MECGWNNLLRAVLINAVWVGHTPFISGAVSEVINVFLDGQFHSATQLETNDDRLREPNKGDNKWKSLDFSFKYDVDKRENPTDGIKDHKALLLLVPSPFKEMMWTVFQAVIVSEVNLLSARAK